MPALVPIQTRLRDGTPVLIRTVTPADAPLLELGYAQLSDRSRIFRFLRAAPRLSAAEIDFFTRPQSPEHEAIGALDLSPDPPAPCGIAHAIRLSNRPDRAELAVTVLDAWQGRGLGTLLFGVLAKLACADGTRAIVALVHSENRPMLRLLADLGARVERVEGAERVLVLPLHADPARYPATAAGEAFRSAYRVARVVQGAGRRP